MKYLVIILIAMSLMVFSGCDLKRFSASKSMPANTKAPPTSETLIPPKVGNFTREEPPKMGYINGADAPNVNKENWSAPYAVSNDANKLSFSYVNGYDKERVDSWIKWMISDSTEDCKDLDAQDLKVEREQAQHYKIIKRESQNGGEMIVMHKDPKSLCNKGQKEEYEKVYFVRGDTIFLVMRYDLKEYGAAEQFMNEYLKTLGTP